MMKGMHGQRHDWIGSTMMKDMGGHGPGNGKGPGKRRWEAAADAGSAGE
jgi:hypothetical protein